MIYTAPDFTLLRVAIRENGAFGVLKHHVGPDLEGVPIAVTLERTYAADDVSVVGEVVAGQKIKIPQGRYIAIRKYFGHGGYDSFEIQVPRHTGIFFHKGNVEAHSEGCVLVARYYTGVGPFEPGVYGGDALDDFLHAAAHIESHETITLDVRNLPYGQVTA